MHGPYRELGSCLADRGWGGWGCGWGGGGCVGFFFFFSSRRRHTRLVSDWSSDVCSSDLTSVAEMLASDCRAWIAEIDGKSIGFSIANATERNILGLFVLPAFEGLGAGRILLEAAEAWLWESGAEEIWLVTGNDPSLRAYGFYGHLNWIPVGVESEGDLQGEMRFIKKNGSESPSPSMAPPMTQH